MSAEPFPAPAELRGAAEVLFGDRLGLAERYAGQLVTSGIERGLIGPRETARLWDRHLLNCAALIPELPRGATVADVGSGAGLPGLVIAIARPDLRVTLIETMERRADWLREVIADLGVDVEVLRARAEDLHGERTFDVVTARAVAALDKLALWTLPLVAPGGRLAALKGSSAHAEIDAAQKVLRRLHGIDAQVRLLGADLLATPTTVVTVAKAGPDETTKGPT